MLFSIIIIIAIIAAVLLGLVVLIQNPKGGGLSGTFGGAANQIFGYKRTTDDIEKITWILVVVVFVLCLGASAFNPSQTETNSTLPTGAEVPTNQTINTQDDQSGQDLQQPDGGVDQPDNGDTP
ncbi:MAG: preprotein translocase subunit SecG [Chitinophagales bacterium]